MYLDFLVNIPIYTGRITYRKKGDTDYVYYEYKRIYTKGTNITNPKRVTIGKRDKDNPSMMIPNENYLKYFPDEDLPEINERTKRSSCLRIGTWLVIRKIIEEYKFTEILGKYISRKDLGLVLDLAAYSILEKKKLEFQDTAHLVSRIVIPLSEIPAVSTANHIQSYLMYL